MIPLIHIFGNPDLPCDALPPRLLSRLCQRFPNYRFSLTDPNELDTPKENDLFIAIDTVDGLKVPREISLDEIAALRARTTAHDFDFASFILLVKKLRKNIGIRIFGIPMGYSEEEAYEATVRFLESSI